MKHLPSHLFFLIPPLNWLHLPCEDSRHVWFLKNKCLTMSFFGWFACSGSPLLINSTIVSQLDAPESASFSPNSSFWCTFSKFPGFLPFKITKLISFVPQISSYFLCSYLCSWYYHSPRHSDLKPQSSKRCISPHFSQIFNLHIPLFKIC